MSGRWRFATVLGSAFAVVAVGLYLLGCVIILAFQSHQNRLDLQYLLYSEAEGLASYIAASGRYDYPELVEMSAETPSPVWLRVVGESGIIVAETPGTPLPLGFRANEPAVESLRTVQGIDGKRLALVEHEVWSLPGTKVQAVARLSFVARRQRELLASLLITGLILLPISALAGRILAQYLLRPIHDLLETIVAVDPADLDRRVVVDGRIAETDRLAREFNALLDRVEQTFGRMERFTTNASHELRTPIASLRAGIEVALRHDREPAAYRELLEEQLFEIERLQRAVEGLLSLARDRGASENAIREPVALEQVAENAVRSLRPLAAARDIRFSLGLQATVVAGDAAQLGLLLTNLLDNAIRHTPAGSEVEITTFAAGGAARLRVRDHGPGIPPEDRPFIFERHYQGGRMPPTARVGGIGLDVVRWVAASHGGSVGLIDCGGPGACFEVELPLWKGP